MTRGTSQRRRRDPRDGGARPQAVALRHGERALTYGELDERSNRLAQALAGAGARRRDPGRLSRPLARPRSLNCCSPRARPARWLVPLNWRLAAPELAPCSRTRGAPLLVAGPAYREMAEDCSPGCRRRRADRAVGDEYEADAGGTRAAIPGGRGEAGDVVVQMYTSGTTGVPKGVLTTQRNLAAATLNVPAWRFDGRPSA